MITDEVAMNIRRETPTEITVEYLLQVMNEKLSMLEDSFENITTRISSVVNHNRMEISAAKPDEPVSAKSYVVEQLETRIAHIDRIITQIRQVTSGIEL